MSAFAAHSLTAPSPRSPRAPGAVLPTVDRSPSFASPTRRGQWRRSYALPRGALKHLMLALLATGVLGLLVFCMRKESSAQQLSDVDFANIGMRTWKEKDAFKVSAMQQQLTKRDQELDALQAAMRQQLTTRERIMGNIHAQEALITMLQQRVEAEKAEKQRAVYSLGMMAQQLDGCQRSAQKATEALSECQQGRSH